MGKKWKKPLALSGSRNGAGSLEIDRSSAKSAWSFDAQTGRFSMSRSPTNGRLCEHTKIKTALLTLEQENRTPCLRGTHEASGWNAPQVAARGGSGEPVFPALRYAAGVSNDAANAAAVKIAGNIEGFARLMNDRAAEIAMANTHFVTPSVWTTTNTIPPPKDWHCLRAQRCRTRNFLKSVPAKTSRWNTATRPIAGL